MKLLSPKEVKLSLREEEDRHIKRGEELTKAIQAEEKKLNDLRTRYALAEVELHKQFELNETAFDDAKKELMDELTKLEAKLVHLRYSTDEARMKEREKNVSVREADLASREAFYTGWKQELNQIEKGLETDLTNLAKAQEALRLEERNISLRESVLSQNETKVAVILLEAESRMDVVSLKEKELALREEAAHSRLSQEEFALRELEKSLLIEREQIHKDRIALADGYATLERAREKILGRKP